MNPSAWGTFLDRYGIPVVMLAVLVWAIRYLFWPELLRQIERNRQILIKQLDEAQSRIDKSGQEFLHALHRRDEIMQREFQKLHDRLGKDTRKRKT